MKRATIIYIVIGLIVGAAMLMLAINGIVVSGPSSRRDFRAEAEIRQFAAALEAYRVDHGHYPTDTTTERLRPNTTYDPAAYVPASAFLYRSLAGEGSPKSDGSNSENYLGNMDSSRWHTSPTGVTYFVDPWGNSFGYSTFKSAHPDSPDGENLTFDLWSTGGGKTQGDMPKWIKNW